jgi:hypothetical protein
MMCINVSGSARYVFNFSFEDCITWDLFGIKPALRTTNAVEGLFHPLRVNERDPIFKEFKITFFI